MVSTWTAISATVRGNWHEKTGQKNQDAVRVKFRHGQTGMLVMAVSDGHGSARSFRSDRGSELAVDCTVRLIDRFTKRFGHDAPLSLVRNQMKAKWWRELLADWRRAVRDDILADPFSPLDFAAFPEPPPDTTPGKEWPFSAYLAYGATLLVTVVTRHYVIYAQLGDGDILTVFPDGTVSRPLGRHHEFFASQSASLCTHGAIHEFQVRVVSARRHPPAAIMLSSDGYANCFGNDHGFFKVGSDLLAYAQERGTAFIAGQLPDWLRESSREGSGDDITVALAVRRRWSK
jgi:hypothetical protein